MKENDQYHFIAIGGIGMSALAQILLEKGCHVTGSDKQSSPITEQLKAKGAKITIGYDPKNLPQKTVPIVFSTAAVHANAEYEAAKAQGYCLVHRSELLGKLIEGKKALLVAGTHGKTTTSSLLSFTLLECGLNPSFAVGGILNNMSTNGKMGSSEYFVAEACESDGSFLCYPGYGGIVTNIDGDHLDYWKDKDSLIAGFSDFLKNIDSHEHLFFCIDDEWLSSLNPKGISYGFSERAEARVLTFSADGWTQTFTLLFRGKKINDIQIPLIGRHNVLNSAAVFALGLQLGVEVEDLRKALSSFRGIQRRVEKKGEAKGIAVYDDYGHHPTEIKTTLAGLKKAVGKKRLVAVFQPHRFTRTRDCWEEFDSCFEDADLIFLTDIYGAGEPAIHGIHSQALYEKMKAKIGKKLFYSPASDLKAGLLSYLKEGDVVLTIGAGDITKLGGELLQTL
jgi:UDP-N-acetylmuramate--alanine ligase